MRRNAWHYSPGADPSWPVEAIDKGLADLCPLKRVAVPQDIARVVAFLAHRDSEWVNVRAIFPTPNLNDRANNLQGQVIKLSGGSIA